MIVTFDKDYLRELYESGKDDKKHRFQKDIVKRYKKGVDYLKKARRIEIKGVDPRMIANNIEPYEPTHPGELIRDEIEYRHISQKYLAERMGVSYTVLNDIVNGRRAVNTKFALLIEAALGIPAYILTGLQSDYDMQTAKHNESFMKKLQSVSRIAAVL